MCRWTCRSPGPGKPVLRIDPPQTCQSPNSQGLRRSASAPRESGGPCSLSGLDRQLLAAQRGAQPRRDTVGLKLGTQMRDREVDEVRRGDARGLRHRVYGVTRRLLDGPPRSHPLFNRATGASGRALLCHAANIARLAVLRGRHAQRVDDLLGTQLRRWVLRGRGGSAPFGAGTVPLRSAHEQSKEGQHSCRSRNRA